MNKLAPTAWQPVHYADVLEDSERGRLTSRISGLRLVNNEVKRQLIREALRDFSGRTVRVADICCGRGGDINKFVQEAEARGAALSYVGADLIPEQIACARSRVPDTADIRWLVGDCFSEATARAMLAKLGGKADIVSCQFALHYAFSDSATLGRLLDNVRLLCAPGGSFIFTTTDSDMVLEYATQEQHADAACTIRLDKDLPDGPFGAGLVFRLDNRVNDREWLVHQPTLHSELTRRKFSRLRFDNLQHYAHEKGAAKASPNITQEDWSICRLYVVGRYINS